MSVDVQVDAEQAMKDLDPQKLKNAILSAMTKTGLKSQAEWSKTAPRRTGTLANSSQIVNLNIEGFELHGIHYWVYVNYGHGNYPGVPFVTQISENLPQNFIEYLGEEYK